MANPYLDKDFNPENYGLTIFQKGAILSAEQLNGLFGFLLDQNQQTRSRLIGVGIVSGLEPRFDEATNSITVSAGYGVTTDGDLLSLEENSSFTQYSTFIPNEEIAYKPFQGFAEQTLWELFPAGPQNEALVLQPLTPAFQADKVVLLYLESNTKSGDSCTGVGCDAHGSSFRNKLRILLVTKADAPKLISKEQQQAVIDHNLPPLTIQRLNIQNYDRTYSTSSQRIYSYHDHLYFAVNKLSFTLTKGLSLVQKVSSFKPLDLTKLTDIKNILFPGQQNVDLTHLEINWQYINDWILDVADAYNEFRETTADWLAYTLLPKDAFPKHLLLGATKSANPYNPEHRHEWLQSPAVAAHPNTAQRAIFYYERIGKMVELFRFFPFVSHSGGKIDDLKITPDYDRSVPISQRSIPFYYDKAIRQFWSYERTKYGQTNYIQSYHQPDTVPVPDEVKNPFEFQIENYPFYRIEGLIGLGIIDVLRKLIKLRTTYNLAFDIVALKVDQNQQYSIPEIQLTKYQDLIIDFDNILADIHFHTNNIRLTPPATLNKLNVQLMILSQERFKTILSNFRTTLDPYQKDASFDQISRKLQLLEKVRKTFLSRNGYEYFGDELPFEGLKPFLLNHPGLEHGTGVPKGGTFVIIHKDPDTKAKEGYLKTGGDLIVTGNYYLPYRSSKTDGTVPHGLPDPKAIMTAKNLFRLNDASEEIHVSPAGGDISVKDSNNTLNTEMATKNNDGKHYFNPIKAGKFTLTYTVTGRSEVSLPITVNNRGLADGPIFPGPGQPDRGDS